MRMLAFPQNIQKPFSLVRSLGKGYLNLANIFFAVRQIKVLNRLNTYSLTLLAIKFPATTKKIQEKNFKVNFCVT